MKKFFFNLCSLTMLVMAMSANTYAQSVPTLYGVVYSEDMYWLASFDANETADFNLLFYDDDLEATGGVFYAEGLLYTHWLEYNAYGTIDNTIQYIYDVKTGMKIQTREITSQSAGFTIAYDESEDCVYGYFQEPYAYDEEQYMYGRMNLYDGWTTELGRISIYKPIVVLAFNSAGEGYGVDYAGNFVKIDKTNGESTVIGSTGMVPAEVAQSACFDPVTGKFYWAAVPEQGTNGLYEINLETGAATLVTEFDEDTYIMGLYIPYPEPTSESPEEVDDIVLNFETTSLAGQVTFTAPTTTVGGQPITGPFKAYVFLDTETKEIDVMPGQTYTVDMEVSTNAMYNCRVWTMIGDNRSAKHTVTKWIGADYPVAPGNIQLFEENGKVVLTWETPTEGMHGGYINPAEVTYIISRAGIWVDGITGNRYEEDMPSGMATYTYSIRSSYNGLNGGTGVSPSVTFGGCYEVPFDLGFSSAFEQFTVIDANDDGTTWGPYWNGSVRILSRYAAGDDWLISPDVKLEVGKSYKMTINAQPEKYFYTELLDVFLGQGLTVDAMTTKIGSLEIKKENEVTSFDIEFTCPADGKYNFGFHCTSTNGFSLSLYTLSVVEASVHVKYGDVDGDGNVNISDVTALIDYLLSSDASSINLDAADCDHDTNVNISDVTALIDYLLSGTWN